MGKSRCAFRFHSDRRCRKKSIRMKINTRLYFSINAFSNHTCWLLIAFAVLPDKGRSEHSDEYEHGLRTYWALSLEGLAIVSESVSY